MLFWGLYWGPLISGKYQIQLGPKVRHSNLGVSLEGEGDFATRLAMGATEFIV